MATAMVTTHRLIGLSVLAAVLALPCALALNGCGPRRTPQDVMAEIIQVKLQIGSIEQMRKNARQAGHSARPNGERVASETIVKIAGKDGNDGNDGEKEPTVEELRARLAALKEELRQAVYRRERTATDPGGSAPRRSTSASRPMSESERLRDLLRSDKEITGRISGKIVDLRTGRLLTAHVRVIDRRGNAAGGRLGFWPNGTFSLKVLTGPVTVRVSRGPAYRPWSQKLYILPGAHQRLAIRLAPARTALLRGWVAVDLHVSISRGTRENSWPSAKALTRAARGEGVDVLALTSARGPRPIDLSDPALRGRSPLVLGASPLWRLGIRGRAYALSEDLAAMTEPLSGPGLSLGERAVAALGRGRLVVCRHPTRAREADPRSEILPLAPHLKDFYRDVSLALPGLASELPILLSAGGPEPSGSLIGALDLDLAHPEDERLWHFLLNRGHRIPAVYTAPEPARGRDVPRATTLVKIDGPATRRKVLDAIRHGRVMVSQGPLVFLSMIPVGATHEAARAGPGDTIRAGEKPYRIVIRAYAEPLARVGIERIELIRNGEVRFQEKGIPGQGWLESRLLRRETAACWYVARVYQRSDRDGTRKVAWTNPIYVEGPAGQPLAGAGAPLLTAVAGRVTGAPAGSVVTVEAFVGVRRVARTRAGANGNYALRCSPYARIVARAEGVLPDQKRVYPATRADELVRRLHCQRDGEGPSALWRRQTWSMARMVAGQAKIDLHLLPFPKARQAPSRRPRKPL